MRKSVFILFCFVMCSASMLAQQMTITGTVIDNIERSALVGVGITVQGKNAGTITDIDGKYTIEAEKGDVLTFAYVGMNSQKVTVRNSSLINVTMTSNKEFDDVVVIGYGTSRKSDLTGAVGSVKMDEVMKSNPISINQALQGRLAGVSVYQDDGAPGSSVSIQIRGANSFSTSTEPLYVVDGVPFEGSSSSQGGTGRKTNALSFINPSDIENVEVLKDASSTAIYGSRGANGVVLITTKKGKEGRDQINVSANFYTSRFVRAVEFLEGYDYANYQNEMSRNWALYNSQPVYGIPFTGGWSFNPAKNYSYYNPAPDDFKRGYMNGGTDWLSTVLQNSLSQDYNLSYSGGDEKGSYFISGNMLDQQGTIIGSAYNRATVRANVDRKLRSFIKAGLTLNYTTSKSQFADNGTQNTGAYESALYYPPTEMLHDPATNDLNTELAWFSPNPYSAVRGNSDDNLLQNIHISANVEIDIISSLKFVQRLGFGHNTGQRYGYADQTTWQGRGATRGYATQSDHWDRHITVESMLMFNKKFSDFHRMDAVGALTMEDHNYGRKFMSNYDFPDDHTQMYNMGKGVGIMDISSNRGGNRLASVLGRVNYTIKDRYLFTASGRRDGSSRFVKGNKWANFFSFAFAWRASEEAFIKDLKVFSNLKPRLSYGETGNQGINNYETLERMASSNTALDGKVLAGYAQAVWDGPLNKSLKWETTRQVNAGLDMGFFNNRLNITIDAYYKKTMDLLQQVTVPPSSGFRLMRTNFGHVVNKGAEFTVQGVILDGASFKWDANANIYLNKNKIGGLKGDQFADRLFVGVDQVYIQRNGQPIGAIYGWVEDGFFDNVAEVQAYGEYAGKEDEVLLSKVGEVKYKDMDRDNVISASDRRIIGNVNPDFQFGITNNFSYKNWDLSFFIQGVVGNDMVNANLRHVSMVRVGNIPKFAYDQRWTEVNREIAKFPKAYSGWDRAMRFSDRFVEDGSYVRLKNVNLGYTFRQPVKFISSLNLFVSASNLVTLTNYRWFDPDVNSWGNAAQRGIDMASYPTSATYMTGLKLQF